ASLLARPTSAKRRASVGPDSSMARMPLPAATRVRAVWSRSSMLMARGLLPGDGDRPGRPRSRRTPAAVERARSEFAEALGAPVLAHLQQAQGVGGAVGFHVLAAGEHHPVARIEHAGLDQQLDAAARGLARGLPAAVVVDREHV